MPKYHVQCESDGISAVVDADSIEEAKQRALEHCKRPEDPTRLRYDGVVSVSEILSWEHCNDHAAVVVGEPSEIAGLVEDEPEEVHQEEPVKEDGGRDATSGSIGELTLESLGIPFFEVLEEGWMRDGGRWKVRTLDDYDLYVRQVGSLTEMRDIGLARAHLIEHAVAEAVKEQTNNRPE